MWKYFSLIFIFGMICINATYSQENEQTSFRTHNQSEIIKSDLISVDSLAIQDGLDKIKGGEILQTLGFSFAVVGPILEEGIALLINKNGSINHTALLGIQLATIGAGMVLYCVGTKIKCKGKLYIELGVEGIGIHF